MTPLGRKYTLRTSMTWKSYSVVFLTRIKIINLNNKILAVKNFYDSRWTYLVSTYWIKSFKFPSFLETVFNYIFLVLSKEKLICIENVIKTSLPQLNYLYLIKRVNILNTPNCVKLISANIVNTLIYDWKNKGLQPGGDLKQEQQVNHLWYLRASCLKTGWAIISQTNLNQGSLC